MPNSQSNPKRWYLVMGFCLALSFFAFVVGPRIGYEESAIRDAALWIGLLAPTMGILGVRAELTRKE